MDHPYAELIGLTIDEQRDGYSKCSLAVSEALYNPQQVVHGGVIYALADTGMGSALYPGLSPGQFCATIEVKINYYKPVVSGRLTCITEVVNRGKRVANLESNVYLDDTLVAKANGNYAIFRPGQNTA